ncbi:MAG TPA: hypothetical protein VEZ11_17490 [Thermoanaerobaculia bacterium]|nr:hypothetical protein [Thermoanaerobaculia bacterium]
MFRYRDTIRKGRLAKQTDHCGSDGPVFDLAELTVNGRVRDPWDRRRLLTTRGSARLADRVLIYAVAADLQVHVGFDGVRGTTGAVKHETLFHNAAVRAAGEIVIVEGVVQSVNDHSGSYRTHGKMAADPGFARAVLGSLDRAGAAITAEELTRLKGEAGQ